MSDPVWITPVGSLGSYGAGITIIPIVLEATPVLPATSVTYTLYGKGGLPQGFSLSNSGVITGTPVINQIGDIFEFTVKVTDNYGNSSTRSFSIQIIAEPPIWSTPEGLLGTYTALYNITSFNLVAIPQLPATTVFYRLVTGALPPGITISKIGIVSGIPTYVQSDSVFEFTIEAIDDRGNSSSRTFSMQIQNPSPVWSTPKGSIGNYTTFTPLEFTLSANPTTPAVNLTYKLISGTLPTGVVLATDGRIYGYPNDAVTDKTYSFVVRATDNLGNVSDRGFTLTLTGNLAPTFTTLPGSLFETQDSLWIEYQIQYNNPNPNNVVIMTLANGQLPPGLQIDDFGLIRGYPTPPTVDVNLVAINATATATSASNNSITVLSTSSFVSGRPIIFSGTVLGGLVAGITYYVKDVLTNSTFTVSTSINGPIVLIDNDSGLMNCTLPQTTQGEPTIKIYSFTLKINSALGTQLRTFSIKVINQNAPVSQGGPGKLSGTRVPVIYNTRPFTYNINQDVSNYGFYVLPPIDQYGYGYTYPLTDNAVIGTFYSGNFFAFKILGYDFDNQELEYIYDIPLTLGFTGDANTGWIRGIPNIAVDTVSVFSFSAAVRKKSSPSIVSDFVNFSFILTNNITSNITWVTNADLGNIYNGTPSVFKIEAMSDVELQYAIVDGTLPNNLQLLPNGELIGTVAFETTSDYVNKNTNLTYTFTVNAFSDISPTVITSTKTFTLTVVQEFIKPTDTLYIECTPSIRDRILIDGLLNNTTLIPNSYLYRPDDPNFGKATNVTYVHAYGIYASSLTQYIAAVQKNHYWRNITLGKIKTALAKDSNGEIIYEVVYAEVVDNLVNPKGISVSEQIYWPRFIDLNLGPWYTSITNIYTSNIYPVELDIVTQDLVFNLTTQENQNLATNQGQPTYYTSLTPGYARTLYPNSLENMRKRVEKNLGVDTNAALLPLWMTSQQHDGNTLGFTPAWVIAYCKPGVTSLPDGTEVSYAEYVQYQIQNNWKDPPGNILKLNLINFQIDRFTVNKSLTYDYDNTFTPNAWTNMPSAEPVPNPIDSKNFNVLFPQKTILPTKTQYPR